MKPSPFLLFFLTFLTVAVLAVLSPLARADSSVPSSGPTLAPDVPPPGLTPSTSTVDAVMAAWRAAEGKPKFKVATEIEVDSIDAYGLTGSDRTVTAGDDYRDTFTLGPVTTQSGIYNGQRWRLNENGIVVYEIGVHKKNEIDAQALRSATNAPNVGVTLAGEVQRPFDAYILKVNPPSGRLEWLYIDKKTALLDREDDAYPDKRLTITYDDYRPVNGFFEPWHTHISDGYPANEVDEKVQSDDVNVKVSDDLLKIPSGNDRIATFPPNASTVTLPARVDDGSVVVRLTINGRGLDFLLDSGASGILMDSEVAKELGIKTFGESVQTTMGAYESTQAIVPEMDVGPIALHNTYVECVPFTQQLGFDTKIVGLLGFDFLANAAVSINYDSGAVTAAPPDSFAPPVNSIAVPVALDDGVPFVQVQIGDSIGSHFILDTGADMIVIFSEFAAAHPQDVVDQGLGKSLSKYLPFVSAQGVGGEIHMTLDQLASYHFGTVNFTNFLAFRTPSGSAFEFEDTDGLVGYEVLQYFTVTFDYKDGMIYLNPGDMLRSRQAVSTPTPHPKAM
jgi:predicted aspartyl protease